MSLRIRWRILPLVATLTVWTAPSFAQSLVCHPIRRGESAADAARRVTGDSRKTYSASFQIKNASSRFVPKSQYDRIRAGWRACVVTPPRVDIARNSIEPIEPEAIEPAATEAPIFIRLSGSSAASVLPRDGSHADLAIVWLGAVIAAPWLGLRILDVYRSRRDRTSALIQHFANRFITEFERPLVRYDSADPPLKSRVRRARRGRFDILLAPGSGRRYPNLTDHKRNVEYDVARVMDVLGDDVVVRGPLSMHAGWVVVPFESGTRSKGLKIT